MFIDVMGINVVVLSKFYMKNHTSFTNSLDIFPTADLRISTTLIGTDKGREDKYPTGSKKCC